MKNESYKNKIYQDILNDADSLALEGKFKQALDLLDEIPKSSGQYCESLAMKSRIHAFMGNREQSYAFFKEFLFEEFGIKSDDDEKFDQVDMYNPDELFHHGLCMFYIYQDYGEAIEYFNMALKLNANDSEVIYHKALSYLYMGKLKKSAKILDEAIKIDCDISKYWNAKGAIYSELNYVLKAHKAFDRAIELEPTAEDWSNKGTLYYRSKEFDKSLSCFDEAIKLNPNDLSSIVSKAGIYSELEDFKKAEEYFEMARMIDDEDVEYLVEMGKHLLNIGEFQKSISYFDRCLESDGEMALAWMYKSMALSEIGMDGESEKCFKRAIYLDPHSINVFDEVLVIED